MSKIVCIGVLVTVVVATTQAFPMREMSEKEAALRELLKMDEKFWDSWFGSDDETTTEAPTTTQQLLTTEAPAPAPFVPINQPYSHLTSSQLCGMMQALYKRRDTLESKRDVVINMMYNLCFPPSGLDAAAVLAMFNGVGSDIAPLVEEAEPTEAAAEEEGDGSSRWKEVIAQAIAQSKNAGTEEDENGQADTDTGTDTGAEANANTGTDTEAAENTNTGTDTETPDNANTGTDTEAADNANTGTDTGAAGNANTGADTNTDTGADTNADAGTENGADTEAGAGADTATNEEGGAAETQPASAKRFEDAELLELLLKAVELNRQKHNN